jgi:hypothetical protein
MRRISLELDTLLKVHQVHFDLVGAVPEREVGDEHVQEGGLARTCAPGDEGVLRRAAA